MSSNFLSRVLPPRSGNPSIYETIREHEEAHAGPNFGDDLEEGLDERNLEEDFRDQDIEDALAEATESQTNTESTAFLSQRPGATQLHRAEQPGPRWTHWGQRGGSTVKEDDDVPQSLLFEGDRSASQSPEARRQRQNTRYGLPEPVPGPSTRNTRIQWDTTRAHHQLHSDTASQPRRDPAAAMTASGYYNAKPKEKALWRWANVDNLDKFLADVYEYYTNKGMWSITLSRLLGLAQSAFIVGTGIFLNYCVDYTSISTSKSLPEVVIPQCTANMTFFPSLMLWCFMLYWFLMAGRMVFDLRNLRNLHDFYLHLLNITDEELQTISWQEIVGRLMDLRNDNPRTALEVSPKLRRYVGDNSKDRMDAIDIANRIMRRENYMIALFNKEIFNLTLPIPFLGTRQFYSKNLEWNLQEIILSHFFNEQGQVYQYFLKPNDRQKLIKALQDRFLFYGCMNLIQAPFLITYYLTVYVLRYFKEFQRDPSQIGSRAYTPIAEWKFREFNELRHFFRRRTDMSFPFASRYLDQFPKDKTVQVANFVAFVSGALLALLAMASLLDPRNFLNFELGPERTVLFYLGVLTVIWTVCRGIVPEENQVFDPEFAIQEVINYTHHCPAHWKGRLHSDDVRKEFSSLYQMRVLIFLEELASFVFAPLVLWYSMPKCADRLVDFFREFTVHVDGVGYVCSYAQFEFNKSRGPDGTDGAEELRKDYYASNDNKAYASYNYFKDQYGYNPKAGGARGKFNLPPSAPGLATPGLSASVMQRRAGPSQPQQAARSMHRSQVEPSQSLLLDPHHQPPASVSRRSPKQVGARSRVLPSAAGALDEADEEALPNGQAVQDPMTSTTMIEEDSHLGDSWKTTHASPHDDDDTEAGARGVGAGVLGLLYQFQKAQTEGKGAGVGI